MTCITPLNIFIIVVLWFVAGSIIYHLLHQKPGKLEYLFASFIMIVCIFGSFAIAGSNHHQKINHYTQAYIESNSP